MLLFSSASVLDCENISRVFNEYFWRGFTKIGMNSVLWHFCREKLEKVNNRNDFCLCLVVNHSSSLHPSKTFPLKLARFASNEITARNTTMLANVLVSAQTEWYQKAFNSIESLSSYEQMRVYHNPPQPLKSLPNSTQNTDNFIALIRSAKKGYKIWCCRTGWKHAIKSILTWSVF